MKKIILILLFAFALPSFGQSISIFNIDTTNYPIMKAKCRAFDKDGKQVRPSASELSITENGINRKILSVSCPDKKLLNIEIIKTSIYFQRLDYSFYGLHPKLYYVLENISFPNG